MLNLPEKIVEITRSLFEGGVPYAIGGALALAYAIEESQATLGSGQSELTDSSGRSWAHVERASIRTG